MPQHAEAQTCPRRMGEYGPWKREAGQDTWTTGHGLVGQDLVGRSCSSCGSLHPDRFMELVREGWEVGPTDKGYKAYLRQPPTADEEAQQKADWTQRDAVAKAVRELGERDGKTAQQIAADLDEQWAKIPHYSHGPEAKFYFQHLSEQQQDEFIELHNARRMRIGYPGHFYQPPFFAGPATA
ncbi:hypothetical protein ACWC3Y_10870 [Streptomyces sp. NPDC001296]